MSYYSFLFRPCNVQCTVQGMQSMFIMYTFCDLHTHGMLLFQETLGKGFIHHAVGQYFHLVYTKIVDSVFHALLLATQSVNILHYSLIHLQFLRASDAKLA